MQHTIMDSDDGGQSANRPVCWSLPSASFSVFTSSTISTLGGSCPPPARIRYRQVFLARQRQYADALDMLPRSCNSLFGKRVLTAKHPFPARLGRDIDNAPGVSVVRSASGFHRDRPGRRSGRVGVERPRAARQSSKRRFGLRDRRRRRFPRRAPASGQRSLDAA